MFEKSFNDTLDQYRQLLREERETGQPSMTNDNFDVGEVSAPGQYHLCDITQAKLLDKLAEQKFAGLTSEIRAELLDFFRVPSTSLATKKDPKLWAKVPSELELLKNAPVEQKTTNTGE